MLRIVTIACAFAACAPTYHTIKLVNRTDRAIDHIYIFPSGSADHGASRAALAPNATTEVKVAAGNVDVVAVSAKVRVDAKSSETRTATQTLQLAGPLELVFHDSNQVPPGLDRPATLGVTFRVTEDPARDDGAPGP